MKNLKSVYKTYWNQLKLSLNKYLSENSGLHPTHPLLINIDEDTFRKADIRIMFFGQETNDWEGVWGGRTLDQLLSMYTDFFGTGYCFKYGGQFWNAISKYLQAVKDKYPGKTVSFVWNNLLKIGRANGKGAPPWTLIQIEQESFPVIQEELEILEPNIIIFFTGPYYDEYLKSKLHVTHFNQVINWSTWKLARVVSEKLPSRSFRTYHPNFLWRNRFYDYMNTIISEI